LLKAFAAASSHDAVRFCSLASLHQIADPFPRQTHFAQLFTDEADVIAILGHASNGAHLEQDSRTTSQPRGVPERMVFPFPETEFDVCGGVRRGLAVFRNSRTARQPGFNCMMQFVRQFGAAAGARSYVDMVADIHLELHNELPSEMGKVGHLEKPVPYGLPSGVRARYSVCGVPLMGTLLHNVCLVFAAGRFAVKVYLSVSSAPDADYDESEQRAVDWLMQIVTPMAQRLLAASHE
jgi:hypothetical protein